MRSEEGQLRIGVRPHNKGINEWPLWKGRWWGQSVGAIGCLAGPRSHVKPPRRCVSEGHRGSPNGMVLVELTFFRPPRLALHPASHRSVASPGIAGVSRGTATSHARKRLGNATLSRRNDSPTAAGACVVQTAQSMVGHSRPGDESTQLSQTRPCRPGRQSAPERDLRAATRRAHRRRTGCGVCAP